MQFKWLLGARVGPADHLSPLQTKRKARWWLVLVASGTNRLRVSSRAKNAVCSNFGQRSLPPIRDNPRSCCLHSTTPRQHHNNNNGSALLIPSGACCFGFPYRRRPSRLGGCTRFLILSPAGALKEGFCCLGRYPPFFAVDSSNLPAHKTTQPIFVELVPNHPPSWILMSNRFSTSKMSPKDILQWWYVRSVQQRSHQ